MHDRHVMLQIPDPAVTGLTLYGERLDVDAGYVTIEVVYHSPTERATPPQGANVSFQVDEHVAMVLLHSLSTQWANVCCGTVDSADMTR